MPRHDMLDAQPRRAAIQRLATKHPAICTIPLLPHLRDDLVHRPAVQLIVADNLKLHPILHRVALHGLEAVIAVALDPLVDAEQDEIQAVVMSGIECLEHGCENGAVFSAGRTDGDSLAALEERVGGDGMVDFGLECVQEA